MSSRRFPPPWSVEEADRLLHRARSERAGARLRAAAKLLTRDEARRIAANIAKLPELLGGTAEVLLVRFSLAGGAI